MWVNNFCLLLFLICFSFANRLAEELGSGTIKKEEEMDSAKEEEDEEAWKNENLGMDSWCEEIEKEVQINIYIIILIDEKAKVNQSQNKKTVPKIVQHCT